MGYCSKELNFEWAGPQLKKYYLDGLGNYLINNGINPDIILGYYASNLTSLASSFEIDKNYGEIKKEVEERWLEAKLFMLKGKSSIVPEVISKLRKRTLPISTNNVLDFIAFLEKGE